MSRPRVSFADLRQMLLDMGFTETVAKKSNAFFAHPLTGRRGSHCPSTGPTDTKPAYRIISSRWGSRWTRRGLMDCADFDDFVAATSLKRSAS